MIFINCGKSLNNYFLRYGADELENVISLGKTSRKLHSKHSLNYERDGKRLQRIYKINDEVI